MEADPRDLQLCQPQPQLAAWKSCCKVRRVAALPYRTHSTIFAADYAQTYGLFSVGLLVAAIKHTIYSFAILPVFQVHQV